MEGHLTHTLQNVKPNKNQVTPVTGEQRKPSAGTPKGNKETLIIHTKQKK